MLNVSASTLGFPKALLGQGLDSIFWIFLVAYLLGASVLVYHWQKYGGGSRKIFIIETIFIIGSLLLLFFTFLAIP